MEIIRKNYTVTIDDAQGTIISLRDRFGKEYIGKINPLARFALLDENGTRRILTTENAALSLTKTGEECTLRFSEVGGEKFSCTASVRFGESLSFWRLAVENATGALLEWIDYPCVSVPCDLKDNGGTHKLFSSMMEGVEISDASLREKTGPCVAQAYPPRGWEGIYPGACPMQFLAYYDGESGLYFASHDPGGTYKYVEWKKDGDSIRLIQQTYPGVGRAQRFAYDYDVVLGVFDGDWYGAAEIYRGWLEKSGLLRLPPLCENEDIPAWIKNSPIVVTYPVRGKKDHGDMSDNKEYFPYSNALPVLEKYARAWDSSLLVLLMHWEGTAPWAPPYVWPPYGGEEMLREFSDSLHNAGHSLGLYCSGLGWTQKSGTLPGYTQEEKFEREGFAQVMEIGPTKELLLSPICGWPIREGYDMCPACRTVRETAAEEFIATALGSNADYIQFFDQNLGGNTYACYAEHHGHPPAPGKWMAESMRKLVGEMKEKLAAETGKRVTVGCEAAAAEPFVNDLLFNDLRYNINYKFGTPVPAYNYMFHGYVCNFMGNHNCSSMLVDLHRYPEYIYYRYAYSFLQGDVLTVVLKNDGKMNWEWDLPWDDDCEPDQAALSGYIRMLNDLRKKYSEYLIYGRMEKPLPVHCGEYVQKLSVGNALQHIDKVLTLRYAAKGKRDCQFFVNWTNEEQEIEICLPQGSVDGENDRPLNEAKIILKPREVKALLL